MHELQQEEVESEKSRIPWWNHVSEVVQTQTGWAGLFANGTIVTFVLWELLQTFQQIISFNSVKTEHPLMCLFVIIWNCLRQSQSDQNSSHAKLFNERHWVGCISILHHIIRQPPSTAGGWRKPKSFQCFFACWKRVESCQAHFSGRQKT